LTTRRAQRTWTGGVGQGPKPPGKESADGRITVAFDLDDQADVMVRLEGGASRGATIMALSPGHPNHIALSMDGSSGGFDWLQEQPNTFVERRLGEKVIRDRDPGRLGAPDKWTAMVPAGHPEGYLDAFRNVIAESWRAMQGGENAYPTFGAGLIGVEIVEAALRSARDRRPASLQVTAESFASAYPQ